MYLIAFIDQFDLILNITTGYTIGNWEVSQQFLASL